MNVESRVRSKCLVGVGVAAPSPGISDPLRRQRHVISAGAVAGHEVALQVDHYVSMTLGVVERQISTRSHRHHGQVRHRDTGRPVNVGGARPGRSGRVHGQIARSHGVSGGYVDRYCSRIGGDVPHAGDLQVQAGIAL